MKTFIASSVAFMASLMLSSALAQDVTYARIQTSMGNIDIALDRAKAPITTQNFLDYGTSGYYDQLIFHRVVQGNLIQGGGLNKRLTRRATRESIKSESDNGLKNVRGSIAMARYSDPDSATSQFFINLIDNPSLDRKGEEFKFEAGYTVFGHVVAGMDVADAIGAVPTGPGSNTSGDVTFDAEVPVDPVIILRIDPIDADDFNSTN